MSVHSKHSGLMPGDRVNEADFSLGEAEDFARKCETIAEVVNEGIFDLDRALDLYEVPKDQYLAFQEGYRQGSKPLVLNTPSKRFLLSVAIDFGLERLKVKDALLAEFFNSQVEMAPDYGGLIKQVSANTWDLILLDIKMPGITGLETLEKINEIKPNAPVVILSGPADNDYALRAMKAGAWGYLQKDPKPEELLTSVHRILSGKKYVAPFLNSDLLDQVNLEGLSEDQRTLIKLISIGQTHAEIAKTLDISSETVEIIRQELINRLRSKINAEQALFSIVSG